jgi:hypothetical protein
MREAPWLRLDVIELLEPLAKELGVSEVARSKKGFMGAYRKAGGDPDRLSDWWIDRRNNFNARHMAQVKKRGEALWKDGYPTRRHLALIMWAYSPTPAKLAAFLRK